MTSALQVMANRGGFSMYEKHELEAIGFDMNDVFADHGAFSGGEEPVEEEEIDS